MNEKLKVLRHTQFYLNHSSRGIAIGWTALTISLYSLLKIYHKDLPESVFISLIILMNFLIWQIPSGLRALLNKPVITLTKAGFACERNIFRRRIANWKEVELINDDQNKMLIYIHVKNEACIRVRTRGLDAAHEDIKATAIEFMNTAKAS